MEKTSISSEEVAKKSGLSPVTCPYCGKSFSIAQNLKLFWASIVKEATGGKRVMIKHFGVFLVKLIKGHAISTPVAPDAKGYGDVYALRFRQGKSIRQGLNKKAPIAAPKKGTKK